MDDLGLDDFDPDAPLEDYDEEYIDYENDYIVVRKKKMMINQDVELDQRALTVVMKIWKLVEKN